MVIRFKRRWCHLSLLSQNPAGRPGRNGASEGTWPYQSPHK